MSGELTWFGDGTAWASETDVGTGSPVGGGPSMWDWDCGWGTELIPLEYGGFALTVTDIGSYRVSMVPAPEPTTLALLGIGIPALAFLKRRRRK